MSIEGYNDEANYYPEPRTNPSIEEQAEVDRLSDELAANHKRLSHMVDQDLVDTAEMPVAEPPRCPKCRFVMCEQFDTQRINEHASLATPNGTYICYTCTPPKGIDIRMCLSCSICELSVTKSCCDFGFCDRHYAMHVEVAARFRHSVTAELLRVARMALQQFEFISGERKRGWDGAFLMAELQSAITNAEHDTPERDANA